MAWWVGFYLLFWTHLLPLYPLVSHFQPHFLSIFIFFKRKKKKKDPEEQVLLLPSGSVILIPLLGTLFWVSLHGTSFSPLLCFHPGLLSRTAHWCIRSLTCQCLFLNYVSLPRISSTFLPVSDSETLGSLIFLISLLSVYPSAPLQRCKLHEGKGFSLHLFSFLLCTVYIQWCLAYGRFSINRRQWQPTPVLSPGKSRGWRSLIGCSPWGR